MEHQWYIKLFSTITARIDDNRSQDNDEFPPLESNHSQSHSPEHNAGSTPRQYICGLSSACSLPQPSPRLYWL